MHREVFLITSRSADEPCLCELPSNVTDSTRSPDVSSFPCPHEVTQIYSRVIDFS